MNSESRLARVFIVTLIVTLASWSFAFVFSAIAGELPFPKETLKKAGQSVNKNVQRVKETETLDLTGITDVEVDVRSGDIEVRPTDEKQMRIEFEGTIEAGGKVLEITRDGDELEIKTRRGLESKLQWDFSGANNFIGAQEFLKLRVFVPRSYLKKLELEVASGEIDVRDLVLGELEARASSGDIGIDKSQIDKVEAKLTSGNLRVSELKGVLLARVTSGELKVQKFQGPSIDVRITSGDMNLSEIDSKDVEATATSGDIAIQVKEADGWHFKLHALSGDVENSVADNPNGTRNMRVNATSGDITITK